MSRGLAWAFLVWLALGGAFTVGAAEFRYTRPLEVREPGWTRVALDLTTLEHLGSSWEDLHLLGPDGREVPFWLVPYEPEPISLDATVQSLQETAEGWLLHLDLGLQAPRHQRLFLTLRRTGTLPSCRLEGSADGVTWELLAVDDLFRLGDDPRLQRTSLAYPATDFRYLRLLWPREGGFPELAGVAVETVPGPYLEVVTYEPRCRKQGDLTAVCRLPLGARGQTVRRLSLEVAAEGAVGYRIYRPSGHRWDLLVEGAWRRSETPTLHSLELPRRETPSDSLRLELSGTEEVPRLLRYTAELGVLSLVFDSKEAGTHQLVYGGLARAGRRTEALPTQAQGGRWVVPEPEEVRSWPPLPSEAVSPRVPLPEVRFRQRWRVTAPGARPGEVVRLTVPEELYITVREDLSDLRLGVGDDQLPYLRWSPAEPQGVGEAKVVRPSSGRTAGWSQAEVDLEVPRLPLTSLHLTTTTFPFRREVRLAYLRPRRPGSEEDEEIQVDRGVWACQAAPPPPCRLVLSLRSPATRSLRVSLHDGDNPPLSEVEMALWRRRDVLFFVWPGGQEVDLWAGAPGLAPPVYDLASLGSQLLARPWRPARAERVSPSPLGVSGEIWSHWMLVAALVVAAAFLLVLLGRMVRAR